MQMANCPPLYITKVITPLLNSDWDDIYSINGEMSWCQQFVDIESLSSTSEIWNMIKN